MTGSHGAFHDDVFRVAWSAWHGHCLKIRFILTIGINEELFSKTTHASGEYVGYNKHFVSGKKLCGGRSPNPVYGEVLAHERGHGKAYLEVLKPKIEKEFEPYCNDIKFSTPAKKAELEKLIRVELNTLRNDVSYLQKTAEYANAASVAFYSTDHYSPVTPPVYPATPGLEYWFPAASMDYVWRKK